MFKLMKNHCNKCGEDYIGTHICPALFKSDYDRGFEDGGNSVPGYKPIKITSHCYKCGKDYIGTHICPELFKSDYDRGYDAGKEKAERELGVSGINYFKCAGK